MGKTGRADYIELRGPRGGDVELGWAYGPEFDSLTLAVHKRAVYIDLRGLDVDQLATLDDILVVLRERVAEVRQGRVLARADALADQVGRESGRP